MTYHTDVAIFIALVDVWQLDGRPAVAAIEDNKQCAARRQRRYQCFVERIATDLTALFVINWYDSVIVTRSTISVGIFNLSAVACFHNE